MSWNLCFPPRFCCLQTAHNFQLWPWDGLVFGQNRPVPTLELQIAQCCLKSDHRGIGVPVGISLAVYQHIPTSSWFWRDSSPTFSFLTLFSNQKEAISVNNTFAKLSPTKTWNLSATKTQVDCCLGLAGWSTNTGLDSGHTLLWC